MRRSIDCRRQVLCILLLGPSLVFAQETLKARVELNKGSHRLKDASNAVIWLTRIGVALETPRQKPSEIPRLVQKNKQFHPSLIVVPVGGKVEFPNHDPFFHNVFSLFEGERFDLGLYESGSTRFVKFDKPGISYIFCNIHAEMSAVIIAVETPYYGISDARGEITLPQVPPGRYALQVFHTSVAPNTLRALNREITITEGNTFIGSFILSESELQLAHKNKYGREYDRPDPDSPAYVRQ
jgi:plastocyanin